MLNNVTNSFTSFEKNVCIMNDPLISFLWVTGKGLFIEYHKKNA